MITILNYKKEVFARCSILIALICLLGCKKNIKENDILTPLNTMDKFVELSPVEGAIFYAQNRKEYKFLDELYQDSILPVLYLCDYYEIKEISTHLKETPIYDIVTRIANESKENYLTLIEKDIKENIEKQKEVFKSVILPVIEMNIDSMLEKDVKKTFNAYGGGILNYKKLNFLLGRSRNDFKEMFWEKIDTAKYQTLIANHIESYLTLVYKTEKNYYRETIGQEYQYNMNFEYPQFVIGLSPKTLKHVAEYTEKQKNEIIEDAIKDFAIPMALGCASGGTATVISYLYDIGTFAYDINELIKDIKAAKPDPDDVLRFVCERDLAFQIRNYYLNKCTEQIYKIIEKSNQVLYKKISEEL